MISRETRSARNLSIISLSLLVALTIFIPSVGAYVYDFEDGIGIGWHFEGRTDWHLDETESHDGASSLRSGEIKCTGTSSVYRCVEGPCEISFWWKKNPSSGPYGKSTVLTFSVNGIVQQTCDFSDWRRESYTIPENGTYEVRWDFRKITCYPQLEGAGWIDDVNITPEMVSIIPEGLEVNISDLRRDIRLLKEDVSEMNASINNLTLIRISPTEINESLCLECMETSGVGLKLAQLNQSIDFLESKVKGINTTLSQTNESFMAQLYQINEDKKALQDNVTKMNNTIILIEGYLVNINDTINKTMSRIDTTECIRCDNRVCVGPNDSLNEVINESSYKVIYLENGIYDGPIYIGKNVTNLTIKSVNEWGAIIDGKNADYVIKLDTTSNVYIEGIKILNGRYGIEIKNSNGCKIEGNDLSQIQEDGVHMLNSKRNIVAYNRISSNNNGISCGICINRSEDNLILYNDIETTGILIDVLNSSIDNTICNINDGYIRESGIPRAITFYDNNYLDKIICDVSEGNYVCRCYDSDSGYAVLIDINDYSFNRWCCIDYYVPLDYSYDPDYD